MKCELTPPSPLTFHISQTVEIRTVASPCLVASNPVPASSDTETCTARHITVIDGHTRLIVRFDTQPLTTLFVLTFENLSAKFATCPPLLTYLFHVGVPCRKSQPTCFPLSTVFHDSLQPTDSNSIPLQTLPFHHSKNPSPNVYVTIEATAGACSTYCG